MRKQTGVRHIGGHRYYIFLEFTAKAKAQKEALRLRRQGYGARVYKMGPDWVVYATDTPVLTYSGKQRR